MKINKTTIIILLLLIISTITIGIEARTTSSTSLEMIDKVVIDNSYTSLTMIKVHDNVDNRLCYVAVASGRGTGTSMQCYDDVKKE